MGFKPYADDKNDFQAPQAVASISQTSPNMLPGWPVSLVETKGYLLYALATGGFMRRQVGNLLERLLVLFGRGNVYVELQRHYNRAQEVRNQAAIELAQNSQPATIGNARGTVRQSVKRRQILERVHLYSQSPHARYCGAPVSAE